MANRLNSLTLRYLTIRRDLMNSPFTATAIGAAVTRPVGGGVLLFTSTAARENYLNNIRTGGAAGSVDWPSNVVEMFRAIRSSPSPDEISDLGLIDAFFGRKAPRTEVEYDSSTAQPTQPDPFAGDVFFYPPMPSEPLLYGYRTAPASVMTTSDEMAFTNGVVGKAPLTPRIRAWAIDPDAPWSRVKGQLLNALVAEEVLAGYPWPAPPNLVSTFYNARAWSEFRNFVLSVARPLAPNEIRTSITFGIIRNFEGISSDIENYSKQKEKKMKRKAIVKAIATAVIGVAFSIFAPSVISNIIKLGMEVMNTVEKIKVAVGMAKTAKQFQESDAAFAAEVDRVAAEFDAQAAENERAAQPSPDELEALREGRESGSEPKKKFPWAVLLPIAYAILR